MIQIPKFLTQKYAARQRIFRICVTCLMMMIFGIGTVLFVANF